MAIRPLTRLQNAQNVVPWARQHVEELYLILSSLSDSIGVEGTPWDFDEGSSTTTYSVGTLDLDEGDA